MDELIVRFDDISANSDLPVIEAMTDLIRKILPQATLWWCLSPFSRHTPQGSVYPNPPFKQHPPSFFYHVDTCFDPPTPPDVQRVSHGLIHCNHTALSADAQELSIVTSCTYLRTMMFVPPFNAWNEDTEDICARYQLRLVKPEAGWRNLDWQPFDAMHQLWYLHPWRWTPERLERALHVNREVVG